MEARLQELEQRVAALEAALADQGVNVSPVEPEPLPIDSTQPSPAAAPHDPDRLPLASLTGRVFLGLAGGFLLRAATDEGVVAPSMGVILGLAYALAWIVVADRSRHKSGSRRGMVHSFIAGAIAYPMLIESGAVQALVPPEPTLAAAVLITVAFLALARRLGRQSIAVGAVLGLSVVATGIYVGSEAKGLACAVLIVGSVAATLLHLRTEWQAPAWIMATWTNLLLVFPLIHVLGAPDRHDGGYPTLTMVLILTGGQFLVFLGLFSRTYLGARRAVGSFDVMQTAFTLLLALGAALASARADGGHPMVMGIGTLVFGAVLYMYSFLRVQSSLGKGGHFYYYSTLALALCLIGASLLPSGGWAGSLWMALAIIATLTGARRRRLTLRYHGAAITLTALMATGTLAAALTSALGTLDLHLLQFEHLAVTALVVVCGVVMATTPLPSDAEWTRRLPLAVMIALVSGLMIGLLSQTALRYWPGGDIPDLGSLAAVRTIAGCLVAVALVLATRAFHRPEPAWLVTPLLVILGGKLLIEDMGAGSSATRFIGFLMYGVAWIAAARTVRFKRRRSDQERS